MRKAIIAAAVSCVVLFSAGSAMAYETFIPLGFGYSTNNSKPSDLTPEELSVIGQADIYETELYRKQAEQKRLQDNLNHFLYNRQGSNFDDWIDY